VLDWKVKIFPECIWTEKSKSFQNVFVLKIFVVWAGIKTLQRDKKEPTLKSLQSIKALNLGTQGLCSNLQQLTGIGIPAATQGADDKIFVEIRSKWPALEISAVLASVEITTQWADDEISVAICSIDRRWNLWSFSQRWNHHTVSWWWNIFCNMQQLTGDGISAAVASVEITTQRANDKNICFTKTGSQNLLQSSEIGQRWILYSIEITTQSEDENICFMKTAS
jgi:hypothetical protein